MQQQRQLPWVDNIVRTETVQRWGVFDDFFMLFFLVSNRTSTTVGRGMKRVERKRMALNPLGLAKLALVSACTATMAQSFSLPSTPRLAVSPTVLQSSSSSGETIIDGKPLIPSVNATIRGANKYGSSNNSTILTPSDAALKVGVRPTLEASKEVWQRAWKLHRFMMKPLHVWDGCQPSDSKLALACLWWKAISGNDATSPVYDYQLSYDLLPPVTRWFVHRCFCRMYPRLHHANVEIRTAYLDKSVTNIISAICNNSTTTTRKKKIRLIVMGGGYDTRSFKLLEQSLLQKSETPHHNLLERKRRSRRRWWQALRRKKDTIHNDTNNKSVFDSLPVSNFDIEIYELDLPTVVEAKRKLLDSRLFRRRPWLQGLSSEFPKLIPVDFNDVNATRAVLESIVLSDHEQQQQPVENIILFEGVMIYLDPGIPHALLALCSDVLLRNASSEGGQLCFADRLDNIPGGDEDLARVEMESTGWKLEDWLSKPGLARHMGVASLK
eukprot:g7712.t1 g7712   contig26:107985-109677(-)